MADTIKTNGKTLFQDDFSIEDRLYIIEKGNENHWVSIIEQVQLIIEVINKNQTDFKNEMHSRLDDFENKICNKIDSFIADSKRQREVGDE